MRQIVNLSLTAGLLLALSACQSVSQSASSTFTPANDLIKLATPEIERNGSAILADRLPMIRYDEQQPCTKDLSMLVRTNLDKMTIEQCLKRQWQTIGTLNYNHINEAENPAKTIKKPQKGAKAVQAKS